MVEKKVNAGRLLLGIILVAIGFLWLELNKYASLIIIVGLLVVITCRDKYQHWFCADCGNYIGRTKYHSRYQPPGRCSRCGCNIFTKNYNGSGITRRNR